MIGEYVIVTTDHNKRGVFFGRLVAHIGGTVTLEEAQMVMYWPIENHGVFGLAAWGPLPGARVGPPTKRLKLLGVTAVCAVSDGVPAKFKEEPWK